MWNSVPRIPEPQNICELLKLRGKRPIQAVRTQERCPVKNPIRIPQSNEIVGNYSSEKKAASGHAHLPFFYNA